MLNSNLLNLLSGFSPEEMKEFRSFVSSPFFNSNPSVVKIFEHIRSCYPEFNAKKLEKEEVYRKVFGKDVYNDGFMRTVMFNLQKLAEEYIAYNSFKEKKYEKDLLLLENFYERKTEKLFRKKADEISKMLENDKKHGEDYFMAKLRLMSAIEIFADANRFKSKEFNTNKKKTFESVVDLLNKLMSLTVLSNYIFFYEDSRESDSRETFGRKILDLILKEMKVSDDEPALKLNLLKMHLYNSSKDEDFYSLKEMLNDEENIFSHFDKYDLHNILQHYAQHRIFEGAVEFRYERFELYRIAVENHLYAASKDDYFNDMFFGNVLLVACSIGEYEWVEKFIEENKSLLDPEINETIVSYSYARLNFIRKNFDETLRYLNQAPQVPYVSYRAIIRELFIMTFYELGLFAELSSQLDAYSHYLVKNKKNLSEHNATRAKNFLDYLKRLFRINENSDKKNLLKLKAEIESNSNTIERRWLLKKISELEERI